MARIRTVKPEFFMHDGLAELSPTHRLFFLGLWTLADREGRLIDRPNRIKASIFPYESINVDQLLTDLASHPDGFIERYEVNGQRYIQIPNFLKHQMPHHKEVPSEIPGPDGSLAGQVRFPDEERRARIYQRDAVTCLYCGRDFSSQRDQLCLDHIIPSRRGGTHEDVNLATACRSCNSAKGNKTPTEAGMPWPKHAASLNQASGVVVTQEGKGTGREWKESSSADPPPDPLEPLPIALRLAEYLRRKILENKPDARVPGELVRWADTFRLMLERDGRAEDRIVAVIDWCQADNFWRANILSADKLREKFDQLELAMQRRSGPGQQFKSASDKTADAIRQVAREVGLQDGQPISPQRPLLLDTPSLPALFVDVDADEVAS